MYDNVPTNRGRVEAPPLAQLCSPPTLVTIQLGIDTLAIANISAAKNKAPDIMLNLSMASEGRNT